MTKSIKKRMYRDIAMLIFLLLTGVAVTLASKANAAALPKDKTQVIEMEPGDSATFINPADISSPNKWTATKLKVMIKGNRILNKINDTLNAKGIVLGLFKYEDKYYLSSYLNDKSGRAYCSVEESTLTRYFNNELRLQDVFLASEDVVATRTFGKETINLIKGQLADLITTGKRLFLENSEGMRNDSLAEIFER